MQDWIKVCVCVSCLSRVLLFVTPWIVACQNSSVGFSRQEHWSGLLFPPPGGLLEPGIQPTCPELWADSLPAEPPGKPGKRFTRAQRESCVYGATLPSRISMDPEVPLSCLPALLASGPRLRGALLSSQQSLASWRPSANFGLSQLGEGILLDILCHTGQTPYSHHPAKTHPT